MVKDRHTAIFYTTAVCNLRCRYCVIDKNPALKKIDDVLDESFKGDYYFDFVKELFPDKDQLTRVELWGGEPYLSMHRIYYTLSKLLEYYPKLNSVYGSTNLVSLPFIDEFKGLLEVMGKSGRQINFDLQLSLDGNEEITDMNRGKGVTKKFSERMVELSKILPSIVPDNVTLSMAFKPTLDIFSIHLLNTKEKIIKYFEFFEQFYALFSYTDRQNIRLNVTEPNFAMPTDFTQEDGLYFASFCKNCKEIMQEHKFRFYNNIMLFTSQGDLNDCLSGQNMLCGTGYSTVGFLPNHMVSMCHMAFVDLLADYKKDMGANVENTTVDKKMFSNYYANNFCFDISKLDKYEKTLANFYDNNSKARAATIVDEIVMLAYAGQIQSKYRDQKEAIKGANFIISHMAYCVKDNLPVTGSIYSVPVGTLKVFLNGAEDYILGEK